VLAIKSEAYPSTDKSTKKLTTEHGKSQHNIKMCMDTQLSTRRHNEAICIGREKNSYTNFEFNGK
jgi:hypothetical protein